VHSRIKRPLKGLVRYRGNTCRARFRGEIVASLKNDVAKGAGGGHAALSGFTGSSPNATSKWRRQQIKEAFLAFYVYQINIIKSSSL